MRFTILNSDTGSALEMNFQNKDQLKRWLEINVNFKLLGETKSYLPTRHVRMKDEDEEEFWYWGA
tara:strand:- start:132 stop:326 length:195 start_codon:yes stop_codon:yes gene_type:complete